MFIFFPHLPGVGELFRSWFKPNAPWRQICLQDVMNEVYQNRWQPIPEAFNHQGLKRNIWLRTDFASVVHFKECAYQDNFNKFPACKEFSNHIGSMKAFLNESVV